jgi:metal-responsive CopG/Arc/MetJ family transcriptional regulator
VRTVQVLVKLPDTLLQKIDEIVLEEGYASRQEFIREIIRERIRKSAHVELIEEEFARRRRVRVESRGHPGISSSLQKGCQAGAK